MAECYQYNPNGKRGERLQPVEKISAQRAVFMFPGFDSSLSDNADLRGKTKNQLEGYMNAVHSALDNPKGKGLYAVGYTFSPTPALFKQFYANPDKHVSQEAHQFVETILLPWLTKGHSKPSVNDLVKRMSETTFVSHSYGGIFAMQVCNALRNQLDARGYKEADIDRICQTGVLITTAGNTMTTAKPRFTELNFRGTNDIIMQGAQKAFEEAAGSNDKLDVLSTEHAFAYEPGARRSIVYAPMPDVLTYPGSEGPKTIGKNGIDIHHTAPVHWHANEGDQGDHSLYIRLKAQALRSAVKRDSKTPDTHALMTAGKLVSHEELARLNQALPQERVMRA